MNSTENEIHDSYDRFNTVGLVGVKYFTSYMFQLDLSIDHQLRPRISVEREILVLPRFFLEGEYEYRVDFGWVNILENDYLDQHEWLIGASYMVSRNISIQGNYSNHYGWGGGLSIRF